MVLFKFEKKRRSKSLLNLSWKGGGGGGGGGGRIGGHHFQWFWFVLLGDCFPLSDLFLVVDYF